MKRLFGILKTVFLLCGAVIGAGFLGGAELAEFFGAAGYAPFLALSGALFFIGFFVVFAREKKKAELPVSEKEESLTVKAFFAAELIFSSAMLAGVNEIFLEAGAGEPIVRALAGQGKVVRTVIFTSLFLATFTSFFTCFAAVSEGAERALPKLGKKTKSSSFKTVLFIFVYLFSLAGLNKIIKFVYPIFGALGVCYIVNSAIKLVKAGGKKRDFLKTDKIARYKNTAKSR